MKKNLLFLSIMAFTLLTQAQVSLVKDIGTTSYQGVENEFINYNGTLLFSGGTDSNNFELWTSDGTESGTLSLKDLGPFSSDQPQSFFYSPNLNLVFFKTGFSSSERCWATDGTETGTIKLSETFTFIDNFAEFNNEVVFRGGPFGSNLSKTDGTVSGTVSLSNAISPAGSFLALNNTLYFSASNGGSGYELYSSDGTSSGTSLFLDINSGFNSSSPLHLTLFNDDLYFSADDGINGRELWVSDGTITGTIRVANINPVAADLINPENFTVFNNALYFTATHPTLGTEIFKITTSTGITNLKNIANGAANSNPSNLFAFNGELYFSADDNINGRELWSTTGFSSTTNILKDINTSAATPDSNPSGLTEYNNKLYFAANNDINGRELWVTDGTPAGTVLVDDINTSGDSNPENLTVAGDNLFFSATTPATGKELFKYSINPQITALDPADDATNVALDKRLTITFNKAILANTGNVTIYDASDDSVVETIDILSSSISITGNEILIEPSSDFVLATKYYVQVDNSAIKGSDNSIFTGISDKTTWNFETIGVQNQTITFSALANKTFGDADFQLTATASSNLTVSYTSSDTNVATIIGNTVSIVGVGTTTITASQSGDTNYNTATDVTQTLTVDKATQTITFNALPNKSFGDTDFNLTATASSNLAVSYTSSDTNVATIIGNTVTIVGAGTTTITASQLGNTNYNAASDVTQNLTINKAVRVVTLDPIPTKTFGDPNFFISTSVVGGVPATNRIFYYLNSTNAATLSVTTGEVSIIGTGTVNFSIEYRVEANYVRTDVIGSFTVNKANQTITFDPLADVGVNDSDFNLTGVSSGGLPITYVSSNPSVASVTGNVVSINAIGATTFTASQTGNTNYNAATAVSQSLTVSTGLSTDDFNKLSFNIYPNPAETAFRIDTEKIITNLSIFNIHGQLVKIFKNPQEHYNIEDLTTGIYFVNIQTDEGEITKKLIKE